MAVADFESAPAGLRAQGRAIYCSGAWTALCLESAESRLAEWDWPLSGSTQLDLSGVTALDTAGAWLLHRICQDSKARGLAVSVTGLPAGAEALLQRIGAYRADAILPREAPVPGGLERLGHGAVTRAGESLDLLGFIGETAAGAWPWLRDPGRIRWRLTLHNLQQAGLNALPIVGLLSFLIGIVIAYQGGVLLRQYGADVFIADLVGLGMLRELAPLMTAIIVAGRTGSAYAAQIGAMKVTEEIDALRALGMQPIEVLVLPKLLALIVALPLLTVYADLLGVLGGMVMAKIMLGLSAGVFVERMGDAVSLGSYLIGVGKAPVFAAIIAIVGCYQGFRVTGSAESVGRRTTISVVQAIFLVIVVDAVFSVLFSGIGL